LDGALDEAARSADKVVRHIRVRLLAAKVVIAVGSAGISSIQLVVPELATKADRVIAEGLAYRVANRVVRLGLIKIKPVGADGKGVEEQSRQRRWVSSWTCVDQTAVGRIRIEAVL